jgi:hypothetical protein
MDWIFKVYYLESSLSHPIVSTVKVDYHGDYKFVMTEAHELMQKGCVIGHLSDGRTTIVKPITIEVIPDYRKEKVNEKIF